MNLMKISNGLLLAAGFAFAMGVMNYFHATGVESIGQRMVGVELQRTAIAESTNWWTGAFLAASLIVRSFFRLSHKRLGRMGPKKLNVKSLADLRREKPDLLSLVLQVVVAAGFICFWTWSRLHDLIHVRVVGLVSLVSCVFASFAADVLGAWGTWGYPRPSRMPLNPDRVNEIVFMSFALFLQG